MSSSKLKIEISSKKSEIFFGYVSDYSKHSFSRRTISFGPLPIIENSGQYAYQNCDMHIKKHLNMFDSVFIRIASPVGQALCETNKTFGLVIAGCSPGKII